MHTFDIFVLGHKSSRSLFYRGCKMSAVTLGVVKNVKISTSAFPQKLNKDLVLETTVLGISICGFLPHADLLELRTVSKDFKKSATHVLAAKFVEKTISTPQEEKAFVTYFKRRNLLAERDKLFMHAAALTSQLDDKKTYRNKTAEKTGTYLAVATSPLSLALGLAAGAVAGPFWGAYIGFNEERGSLLEKMYSSLVGTVLYTLAGPFCGVAEAYSETKKLGEKLNRTTNIESDLQENSAILEEIRKTKSHIRGINYQLALLSPPSLVPDPKETSK